VSLEQREGEAPAVRQRASLDVTDPEDTGDLSLPEGATLTKTGTETLKVGGRSLACDKYDVVLPGPRGQVTMTTWHCPRLPPVFMGGVVKLVSRSGGVEATITLVEYEGKLLGE
jgi:hypothetical protein